MNKTDTSVESLNRGAKCRHCGETSYVGVEQCSSCGSTDMDTEWNSLLSNYDLHDVAEAYFKGRVESHGLQAEPWGIDKRHEDDSLIFDNKMDLRLWEAVDGQDKPAIWPKAGYTGVTHTSEAGGITVPEVEFDDGEATVGDVERDFQEWTLRGVADVKSKSNEDWLGKFNLRHLAHYAEWAELYGKKGIPTFIYMTMVDTDAESVGDTGWLTPIPYDWDWNKLVAHYDHDTDVRLLYGELKDIARECDIVKRTFRAPDGNLVVNTADEYKYDWGWFTGRVL